MRHHNQQAPLVNENNTGWTGRVLPYSVGTKALHQDIAYSQVTHWTPQQIAEAERSGYFDELAKRAQAKRYGSIFEDEELE